MHGKKYLQIYEHYLNEGIILKKSYDNEKKKVLIKVLIPMLALSITSKNHFFKANSFSDFIKDYKTNIYMYFAILIELPLCIIFLLIKKLFLLFNK